MSGVGRRAYVNAQVHTMHPAQADLGLVQDDSASWSQTVEALLVVDGRIEQLGSSSAVTREAMRRGISVEDLDARIVFPGFVDAHTHFVHIGVKRMRPALGGSATRQEALQRLVTWLRAHPGTSPVIAEGWDESAWPDHAWLHKQELDAVLTDAGQHRPLVARRICGHIATASTSALSILQRRWPDPEMVHPETGILLEQASLYLNEAIPTSDADLDRAIATATRVSLDLGITTVGDYSQAPYREALLRAAQQDRLGVRVVGSIYVQQLEAEIARGFRTGRQHGMMQDGGLKVFLDGSLGARSAALREPYADAPAGLRATCPPERPSRFGCVGHPHPKGTLNWSDAEVAAYFARAHAAGIQIHAHAIGDAAIDQGLEFFGELAARADMEGPGWDGNRLRHRFEHFEIVHDEQAMRTAELRIVASSQPNFVGAWSSKSGMYEERLGPRFRLNNRFRQFKGIGVPVAFGSDGMPPGPIVGIAAALQHPEEEERLDLLEAVWHYTYASAWALHMENHVGSLAPGKMADFVVLHQTRLSVPPSRWTVGRTVIQGREHPVSSQPRS